MLGRAAGGWEWVLSLIFPSGLCFLAAICLDHLLPASEWDAPWLPFLPLLLLGIGVWIAWRLHRSRILLSAVLIGAVWVVVGLSTTGSFGWEDRAALVRALELLVPVNLALISLSRDRGILHPVGLGILFLFCAQALALGFQLRGGGLGVGIAEAISTLSGTLHWPQLPRFFSAVILGASGLIVLLRFLWRRSAIEAGLFWTLGAVALGLRTHSTAPNVANFYLSAAGAVLLVSTIEHGYFLAYRDELTGLLSRRGLEERLHSLGGRYAIAMVDIDRFKRFNDRHGHDAGDQLLRMVASRLAGTRGGAVAYRYGGEEFALVFAGRQAEEVQGHCEALRKAIAGKSFTLRHWRRPRRKPKRTAVGRGSRKRVSVSVSIGLAGRSDVARSAREVIKRADRALYRAKRKGRNRVVLLE